MLPLSLVWEFGNAKIQVEKVDLVKMLILQQIPDIAYLHQHPLSLVPGDLLSHPW